MIVIIAVLSILLVVACCYCFKWKRSNQILIATKQFDLEAASEFQMRLMEEKEVVEQLRAELTSTASELVRIKDSFKTLTDESDVDSFGTHIKWHNVQRATANTYRLVFDLDIRGREIIEDLVIRFKRNAFVSDQNGGERETSRRLGRQEVIDFILNRCNTATDPRYSEELELLEQQQND